MQPGHFPANVLFILIFVAANGFFLFTAYKLYQILRLGKPEDRFDRTSERVKSVVTFVLGQRRVIREPAGWGHFFIFEAMGTRLNGEISEEQQQKLSNNPYTFKPSEDKMAVFHSQVRSGLDLATSL